MCGETQARGRRQAVKNATAQVAVFHTAERLRGGIPTFGLPDRAKQGRARDTLPDPADDGFCTSSGPPSARRKKNQPTRVAVRKQPRL